MATGLDIVRIVYQNLRQPSDTTLPYRTVLDKVRETVRKKKLDLVLAEQNGEARVSKWFYTARNDFEIGKFAPAVFLPIRLERRGNGSTLETGVEIPLVNYQILANSPDAAAFYGNPLRLAFRAPSKTVADFQYRLIYEPDFSETVELGDDIALPDYFTDYAAAEASVLLIMLNTDDSPEYRSFAALYLPILQQNIFEWTRKWEKFVRLFRGRATVPKRTFFANRGRHNRNGLPFNDDGR